MKISCTQENLNQGLFVVSHIASKNVTLPILNNVLFQVTKDEIQLSATNLEIGVRCTVRGKIEEAGDFTIQSRLLADYINLLPEGQIDLAAPTEDAGETDQVLEVRAKNHFTKIKGQVATDFPVIPQAEKKDSYTISANNLKNAISRVLFAASQSETRPEITGVFFKFENKNVTLAATDSYRLAETKLKLLSGGQNRSVIVPARTLQEIQRILGGAKDPAGMTDNSEIKIYLNENQITFTFGGIELVSRLVDGAYPDYQQIIPQQTPTKVVVATRELNTATKGASLFARSGIFDIMLDVKPDQKEVEISATSGQLGQNTTKLDAVITGEGNSIALNYRYLLDGLQNIASEQVELGIIDASSPCLITPNTKGAEYLYLIMPIKQ